MRVMGGNERGGSAPITRTLAVIEDFLVTVDTFSADERDGARRMPIGG
jgi:hypothetical protein